MHKLKASEVAAPHPTVSDLWVSQCGRLFTSNRELRPSLMSSGYLRVNLKRSGKQITMLVHRAVAEAWLPNEDSRPCVNHIDGDKTNNARQNLEWVTYSQNAQHAWTMGLVKSYERRPEDRERLAHIAKTFPRGRRGHCIASLQKH